MTTMSRRTLLRAAALTGAAAATGLVTAPAAAAEAVNGSWIVTGPGVLQIDPGRTTPRVLLSSGGDVAASPDGRYLAVRGQTPGPAFDVTLEVYDRVTGLSRTLITDRFGVYYEWPTWSPDGTEVALVIGESRLVAVNVATGARRVLVEGHRMVRPNWSRDGSMIVMEWISRSEGHQLRTLELATGKVRRIHQPDPGEHFGWPVFTPETGRVVFSTNRWTRDVDILGGALGSVRVDGTGLKRLTAEPRVYLSPVFSPDGRYCAALSVPPTNPEPDGGNILVATRGFDAEWWIPGDEYDDSSRLDWARAI
ncbi:TolB family protein [Micromonospora robiginosa]|uniref:PD40 domain-containing protein n=1 Tax=Micromonospora robiginosa TaxID=2749844 RepID=A0A7L6B2I5_9ACTN|nr:PD40 domain-containing protein [Micromonospora ferruginea]QLQ36086.1 PD40 domain-containing protein [Micromonospora ferruginea]